MHIFWELEPVTSPLDMSAIKHSIDLEFQFHVTHPDGFVA